MKRTKSPAGKTDDPVYAAIKAHRIAFAKMEVESREHNRWEEVELRKEKEGTELSPDERQVAYFGQYRRVTLGVTY